MKYDHLSLKILDGRFKYVLLSSPSDLEEALKKSPIDMPLALFRTHDEISAVIPQSISIPATKTEDDWVCVRIIGEMPFGTVSGLIATISSIISDAGQGVCVVSTFLTDWFFIREKNLSTAVAALKKAGWKVE